MANLLGYRTHDLDSIGRQVEEVVRKDVGGATTIPYRIHDGSAATLSAGELGRDIAGLIIGHRPSTVAFVELDLPWHRSAVLTVSMDRVGVSSVAGSIHYAIDIARPVDQVVGYELPKLLRPGRFTGGSGASRLNATSGLAKRLGKVVRTSTIIGTMTVRVDGGASLQPIDADTSQLILLTLPNVGLRSATTDAGEVLAIAREIEANL
jgi:hypothetical protein